MSAASEAIAAENRRRAYALLDAWAEAVAQDPTLDPEQWGRDYKEKR